MTVHGGGVIFKFTASFKYKTYQWNRRQHVYCCNKNTLPVLSTDRCADHCCTPVRCVLSRPMLTTLMECIKLSTDIGDETAWVYRQRLVGGGGGGQPKQNAFSNLLNDKELAHKHMHHVYFTWHSVYEASGVFSSGVTLLCKFVSQISFSFSFFTLRHFDKGLYRWLIR